MELFRICCEKYSSELKASGVANRWNLRGQNVLYASGSRSLATLEMIVHRSSVSPVDKYVVMVISVADEDELFRDLKISGLPKDWRSFNGLPALEKLGSEWYRKQESLLLRVPSVVIPQEHNYLINTEHPSFEKEIQLVRKEDYFWDKRLIS